MNSRDVEAAEFAARLVSVDGCMIEAGRPAFAGGPKAVIDRDGQRRS